MKGIPASTSSTPTSTRTSLLKVEGLGVELLRQHGDPVPVVEDVSLEIGAGETVGLVGESGSGKTVTALAILGLLPAHTLRVSRGCVFYRGEDLLTLSNRQLGKIRGSEISMVFQEPMTSLNPAFTVGDQVAEVLRHHLALSKRTAWNQAIEMLGAVGIPSPARRAHEYPHTFSGGMRQRVMIAMAIACEPKLLLADEPTTALDTTVQAEVLELLASLQDQLGLAVLFISHNLGVVAEFCDRVSVMYAGQIVEEAATRDIFDRPFHPYTEGLSRSVAKLADPGPEVFFIPGKPPHVGMDFKGCRFAPRCSYRQDRCVIEDPVVFRQRETRRTRCVRVDELSL